MVTTKHSFFVLKIYKIYDNHIKHFLDDIRRIRRTAACLESELNYYEINRLW